MQISVNIEQTQPLIGTASTGAERSASFVGWLGLLRAISELVEAMEPSIGQSQDVHATPTTPAIGGTSPPPTVPASNKSP